MSIVFYSMCFLFSSVVKALQLRTSKTQVRGNKDVDSSVKTPGWLNPFTVIQNFADIVRTDTCRQSMYGIFTNIGSHW